MAIKTAKELAAACVDVARNYKTLYVKGCFGARLTDSAKTRYTRNNSYNMRVDRTVKINSASEDTYGFDCVCLIKGLLWGWTGDASKNYGGATYGSNGVPDIGADSIINKCSEVSTDFANVQVGELLWMSGHVGIYIGDGLAVECTPQWSDCVQITAVKNIGAKAGYNARKWTKHGKLPYVTYETTAGEETTKKGDFSMDMRIIKKGCTGDDVKAMQTLLIGYGYTCGSTGADGQCGANTVSAIKKYQTASGLTADGQCGKLTWSKLLGV